MSGSSLPASGPNTVSGRVVEVRGASVVIADAYRQVLVAYDLEPLSPGDLVTLRVGAPALGGNPTATALVERTPGDLVAGGQFARFAQRGVARNLRLRAAVVGACRRYFEAEDFLEVQTPTRVHAPGTDVYIEPVPAGERYLITSPEFHHKRLLVGGVPRVFEFARCFRGEEVGPYHEPEFTLLEWYRAFADMESVMLDTERVVTTCAELFGDGHLQGPGGRVRVEPPFARVTVRSLFQDLAGESDASDLAAGDEARYFQLWVDRIEPHLAQLSEPVFVTEFPISQAALARPSAQDASVAERFELVVAGLELCNGYGELCDPALQAERFARDVARRTAAGRACAPVDTGLIAALAEGMPPSGGNALGLDRLVALCAGTQVADVVAFSEAR